MSRHKTAIVILGLELGSPYHGLFGFCLHERVGQHTYPLQVPCSGNLCSQPCWRVASWGWTQSRFLSGQASLPTSLVPCPDVLPSCILTVANSVADPLDFCHLMDKTEPCPVHRPGPAVDLQANPPSLSPEAVHSIHTLQSNSIELSIYLTLVKLTDLG